MSALQIRLLGRFNVQHNHYVLSGFESRKLQELFSYLLLYRNRPHFREALADVLWDETSQSRNYLRKTLWQLQTALDPKTGTDYPQILIIEPEWIQLNLKANIWLDVAILEDTFTLVEGRPGIKLDHQTARVLQDMADIYQGDLLEGCYTDWCLYERERFRHLYLAILDKLMGYCEAYQQYETGITYGLRILGYDRARERTHRQLMRLHYLAGNRTAALRQYNHCLAALDEELGVEPAKSTTLLHHQIQADRLMDITLPKIQGESSLGSADSPPLDKLAHLKHLQKALADVQHHLSEEIRAIESSFNESHLPGG